MSDPIPKEVIDGIVTLLETTPRHQWRGVVTKLANGIEKMYANALDEIITFKLLQSNEWFDKNAIEAAKKAFGKTTTEFLNTGKVDLEKRLKGHPHVSALMEFYIQYRLDHFEKDKKKLIAKSNLLQRQFIEMMRGTYTLLYKEKWKPAKAREELIAAALEMKHGGEIVPHLVAYNGHLKQMKLEIQNDLKEKARSINYTMIDFLESLKNK